jgi:hypothetical protein
MLIEFVNFKIVRVQNIHAGMPGKERSAWPPDSKVQKRTDVFQA